MVSLINVANGRYEWLMLVECVVMVIYGDLKKLMANSLEIMVLIGSG